MRRLRRFASQCPPGKKGRPMRPENAQATEKAGGGVCEKNTREGRTVYYRTSEESAKYKEKSKSEKKAKQKTRQTLGLKLRGRISKEKLVEFKKNLDEILNKLKSNASVQKPEAKPETKLETKPEVTNIVDAKNKIEDAYIDLRGLTKYPAVTIHKIRRRLKLPRVDFDNAIDSLIRERKIDLIPAEEDIFNKEEAADAYLDPDEGRTYYYLQWR